MGAPDLIPVISRNGSHVLTLVPGVDLDDPRTGKRQIEKPVQIKFRDFRAQITPEVWEKLREHPCYTGRGGRKRVWREDELAVSPVSGVKLTTGAMTAPVGRQVPPPSPDWDATGAVALAKRIKEQGVSDVSAAIQYEAGNLRRKTVLRALTDTLGAGPEEDGPPPAAEPPRALIPEDQGGF